LHEPRPPAEPTRDELTITVDHRERPSGLVDLLLPLWPRIAVGTLGIGDVHVGPRVLIERKTVPDLVQSIADGRLFRQLYAMCGESARPLLVIEGSTPIPVAGLDAESLRGVLLSVAVGYRVPMLRTMSTQETAVCIARLAAHEERRLARDAHRRPQATGPLAVLASIPGVGEERAAALLARFGSVRQIFNTPRAALEEVPGIGPETARAVEHIGRRPSPPANPPACPARNPPANPPSNPPSNPAASTS